MPADAGNLRSESPAALDDKSSKRDKKYRQYAANVEKALSLFDTALREWADYISFLGRLLKALQTRPLGVGEIPHTAFVAKRLAQCLDPRLGSGVHQKALEVYGFSFSILEKDGLERDLPLYLPGLSPTLSFASLSVKPTLLSLFEHYVVLLDAEILKPALKAITLALLPGLEDQTSEEFERTDKLLNRFRGAVRKDQNHNNDEDDDDEKASYRFTGDRYFWQSVFLTTMTSSSRRQGALNYLTRHLPRLGVSQGRLKDITISKIAKSSGADGQWPPEIEAVISPEPGLLIRCFAAGLRDDQLLVQRGFLDLLVTHLPLSSPVLQSRVKSEDLELLIAAASSVVARREMSLNRRLWSWFIGPEVSKDIGDNIPTSPDPSFSSKPPISGAHPENTYFGSYGLQPLTQSVRKMIASKSNVPSTRARPFRICLSLMDRTEIGGLIVPQIFIPAIESIRQYENIATSKEAYTEVFRSAQVFFDGIQSRLIWSEIIRLVDRALALDRFEISIPTIEAQTSLDLVWFIITKFNVREEEMLVIHMPMVCLLILIYVQAIQEEDDIPRQNEKVKDVVTVALKISARLLELIPERAFVIREAKSLDQIAADSHTFQPNEEIIQVIMHTYHKPADITHLAFPGGEFASLLIRNGSNLLILALQSIERRQNVETILALLAAAIEKSPIEATLNTDGILSQLPEYMGLVDAINDHNSIFSNIAGTLAVYEFVHAVTPSETWSTELRIRRIAIELIQHLWTYLSPSRPQHSVEAVRCIWRLHSISPCAQLVESSVASLMISPHTWESGDNLTVEGSRRFTTLWSHSSSKLQAASERRSHSGRGRKKPGKKSVDDFSDPEMLARPLLLLLDSLCDQSAAIYTFAVSWLQSLASIQVIVEFVIHRLHNTQYLMNLRSRKDRSDGSEASAFRAENISESTYWLRAISNIMQCSSTTAWTSLNLPILSLEQSDGKLKEDVTSQPPVERISQEETTTTAQIYLLQTCVLLLQDQGFSQERTKRPDRLTTLRRTAVQLMQQLLQGSPTIIAANLPDLEKSIINILSSSIEASELLLQRSLMETLLIVLRGRRILHDGPSSPQQRNVSQVSLTIDKSEKEGATTESSAFSQLLLDCLIKGLGSGSNRPILDQWVRFLNESFLTYDGNAFQALLPLVECFSKSIDEVFRALRSIYENPNAVSLGNIEPINTMNILFNGLEQTLARGHDQLMREEAAAPVPKTPEQAQGFFGNMVSGVFASEGQKPRPVTANERLTVLICFKDTVRIAYRIWSWGDSGSAKSLQNTASSASFNYSSIRLRNRTRRLLEHLFTAEPLECLETMVEMWRNTYEDHTSTIFNLLHALEASRPKNTMPATFNAIYSRTNQSALDPRRSSTLTSELTDTDLATFLVAYTRSIDDDALDEIWADCMAFARDVLGNPMPQRQILPQLLEFVAILGKKIDNTNFGEQRRMRKEIGDLFVRLLAATFTIKPLSFSSDPATLVPSEKLQDSSIPNGHFQQENLEDVVAIMASVLPGITPLLVDTDRMAAAATTISTQIFGPTFRWRTFPHNVTSNTTDILKVLSKLPEVSKIWKKDISDAYNDSRFFCASTLGLAKDGWMPILRQWTLVDKEKMPELLARLIPPTTAGIVFGVGAASARVEADRKAQLNLRRISLLLLSNLDDDFVTNLSSIQEKLTELLHASSASSPSSNTRAELYMLMRALILKISPIHLSSLWPILNTELYDALASLGTKDSPVSTLNVPSLLQAAKLLDTLLTISPDDFQLREWLYITDTIDAVYRPAHWHPIALVDSLAERLDANTTTANPITPRKPSVDYPAIEGVSQPQEEGLRKPLLRWENMRGVPRDETLVERVLRPFLRELSITAFESTYQMESADREACVDDLLRDVFDEGTLV